MAPSPQTALISPGASAVLTAWRRQAGGIAKAMRAKRAKNRVRNVVCMVNVVGLFAKC